MCARQVMDEFVKPASKDAGQGLEGTVDELSERVRAASNRFFIILLGQVSTKSGQIWLTCNVFYGSSPPGHYSVQQRLW